MRLRNDFMFCIAVAAVAAVACLSACQGKATTITRQGGDSISVIDSVQSASYVDTEGLAFWLQDSLAHIDPFLTQALDFVYRHGYHDYHSPSNRMELLGELEWFYQTRDTILTLYRNECLQDNFAQQKDFFERLFDRARTLWELEDIDGSTMEMVAKTIIDTKLVRFQTYLYLTGIFHCLPDDATGAMTSLNREFNASEVFCDAAIDFAAKIANLQNWNGSISSVTSAYAAYSIRRAQMEMYKAEVENPISCAIKSAGMTMRNHQSQFTANSERVMKSTERLDCSWLDEDGVKNFNKELKAAETARQKMVAAAFDTFCFMSYRDERIKPWIWDEQSRFEKASDQRALNFLYDVQTVITSLCE